MSLGYRQSNVIENGERRLVKPPYVLLNQRHAQPVFTRLDGCPNEGPVLRLSTDLHSGIKDISLSFEHYRVGSRGM